MKWVLTLESFVSRLPKTYFVKYSSDLTGISGIESSMNVKIIHMLIKAIFDEVIILEDMTTNQIDEWVKSLKEGDIVWSYSSRILEETPTNKEKKKVLDYFYGKVNKKKGIDFRINDNFTKSKSDYYDILKEYDFMPKTCFTKEEALKTMKFPIVAKIDNGSNGIGVQKFNTKEELKSSKSVFDLYSEYIDHNHEFRVFVLDGKIIYIVERIEKYKDKSNINSKSKNDILEFVYIPQEIENFPYLRKMQNVAKAVDKELGSHTQSIYSIDLLITPDEKVKVIESNSKSQLGPYAFMEVCKHIVDIPYQAKLLIEKVRNLYLANEYKEFKTQINKSLHPISYKTTSIDDELLKALKGFDDTTF